MTGRAWWPSPSLRRGTIVMALVGALIVGLVWFFPWRSDQARRAEPGHVETPEAVLADASLSADFALPGAWLQLGFSVGSSVAGLTEEAIRAPRGGHLVEIRGSVRPRPVGQQGESALSRAKVWLKSGDERILVSDNVAELPMIGAARGSVVALRTGGRDLVAELEYAGRRQSVHLTSGRRDAGSFAPLYRPTQVGAVRGGDYLPGRRPGLMWNSTVSAGWYRTPYIAGLGWAKSGREWLVVSEASLRVTQIRDDAAGFGTPYVAVFEDGQGSIRAGGARAARRLSVALSPDEDAVEYTPASAVFEVRENAATTLRLTVRTPLLASTNPGASTSLVVSRAVAVPATPVVGGG